MSAQSPETASFNFQDLVLQLDRYIKKIYFGIRNAVSTILVDFHTGPAASNEQYMGVNFNSRFINQFIPGNFYLLFINQLHSIDLISFHSNT